MASIDLCLLKALHRITLVRQHRPTHQQHQKYSHVMICFITFSYDSKQVSATTIAHSKRIITLSNQHKIMSDTLSTIWENTDGCAEH